MSGPGANDRGHEQRYRDRGEDGPRLDGDRSEQRDQERDCCPEQVGNRRADTRHDRVCSRDHLEDSVLALELGCESIAGAQLFRHGLRDFRRQSLRLVVRNQFVELGLGLRCQRRRLVCCRLEVRPALGVDLGPLRPASGEHASDRGHRGGDEECPIRGASAGEALEDPGSRDDAVVRDGGPRPQRCLVRQHRSDRGAELPRRSTRRQASRIGRHPPILSGSR
jgi:hypothetical protein